LKRCNDPDESINDWLCTEEHRRRPIGAFLDNISKFTFKKNACFMSIAGCNAFTIRVILQIYYGNRGKKEAVVLF
jgi:hypothetical protein